jgi:hypothetical protein
MQLEIYDAGDKLLTLTPADTMLFENRAMLLSP